MTCWFDYDSMCEEEWLSMKNTYSASGFIFANSYGYFIAWFWYKALLFRSIEGLSFAKSGLLLLLSLIVSLAVGYSTQRKSRMNTISIAMNIVTGYGLYNANNLSDIGIYPA